MIQMWIFHEATLTHYHNMILEYKQLRIRKNNLSINDHAIVSVTSKAKKGWKLQKN